MVMLILSALLVALPGNVQAQSDPNLMTHDLNVFNHENVESMTAREVSEILGRMSTILQDGNAGGDDEACMVGFSGRLAGDFSEGTGVINTEDELDEVLNVPGQVKVVEAIMWCGKQNEENKEDEVQFLGCARNPGRSFVVVADLDLDWAGIVWTHEFGHNSNLPDNNVDGSVMNGNVDRAGEQVNDPQCREFETGQRTPE